MDVKRIGFKGARIQGSSEGNVLAGGESGSSIYKPTATLNDFVNPILGS
jgi:hypothetical protein